MDEWYTKFRCIMHYSLCEIEILFFYFSNDIANFLEEIDKLQEGTLTEQQNAFDLLNYKRQKVGIRGNRSSLVLCKWRFLYKKTYLWLHSTGVDNFMIFYTFLKKNQLSIIILWLTTILLQKAWKIVANGTNYSWHPYLTSKKVNLMDFSKQICVIKSKDYSDVNNCGYNA